MYMFVCMCNQMANFYSSCLIFELIIFLFFYCFRKFAVRNCARCQMPISSQELVMRARELVYHVTCFACASCNCVLNTGEQFGMKDNLIFCKQHYEYPPNPDYQAPGMMGEFKDTGNSLSPQYGFPGVNPPNKGRPRKRKSQPVCGDLDSYSAGLSKYCSLFCQLIFIGLNQ